MLPVGTGKPVSFSDECGVVHSYEMVPLCDIHSSSAVALLATGSTAIYYRWTRDDTYEVVWFSPGHKINYLKIPRSYNIDTLLSRIVRLGLVSKVIDS